MFDISKETYLKKRYKPITEIIDLESSIVTLYSFYKFTAV